MAAKTEEQKEAEAQAKAEQEQQDRNEAAAKATEENIGKLGAANAAAQVAGQAYQERKIADLGERHANISVGLDPETGEEVNDGRFGGQLVTTDHFAAVTLDNLGVGVIEVRPDGWVGEGWRIPASRAKEVVKLLGEVKNLPDQD